MITATAPSITIRHSTIAVLAFALLLFAANGGTFRVPAVSAALWLTAYAATLYWIARAPNAAFRTIRKAWPLLLLPILALTSPLWSVAPARSTIAAIQLTMTILLAIRLSEALSPRAAITALFLAQTLGIALSLANAATGALPPAWEAHGPLLGIYVQKSWMGKAAFWWAFSAIAIGLWYRGMALALAITALAILLAYLAESITALLAFSAVALLLGLTALRRLPASLHLGLPIGLATLAAAFFLIWSLTGGGILATFLQSLGKSETLTGRTILWEIGLDAWQGSPLLGTGYGAFWHSSAFAWEVSFVHARVDSGLAGFHNAYIEALTSLGALGALIFGALIAATLRHLIRWYARSRSTDAAVWLSAVFAICLMGATDDYFFRQHAPHLMLFAMAYIYARRA